MKCDITTSKKFTINTGDYSSIQPHLSVTVKDIDVQDVTKVHALLQTITDGLFHEQLLDDGKTMAVIKNMGVGKYLQSIDTEKIKIEVKESVEELYDCC